MVSLRHDRDFDPRYGSAVEISQAIRRLTAHNPGPFTWHGTNSYLIGRDEVAVLDPGPADAAHMERLVTAAGEGRIAAILVSHTHMDHSPGARMLKQMTGAPIIGCGAHRAARPLNAGERNPLDASADGEHRPDREMAEGDTLVVDGLCLTAIETPGHTANHLAFALDEGSILFSADHVMAWSTSIVAPPDGAMSAYMASLTKLAGRGDARYLPGHGGPVEDPAAYVAGLAAHRRAREQAILDRLVSGAQTIPEMVAAIYADVDPALHGAAALSVLAQVEWLVERGLVRADGEHRDTPVTLASRLVAT
jgi:glyoxylase-like metal-dependent hydrolase (beta-lactamase superfamily II)